MTFDKSKVIYAPAGNRLQMVKALRAGEIVEFDGVKLRMITGKEFGDDLQPGDTYFAERNTRNLLTVKRVVHATPTDYGNWVEPVEIAYSFDFGECVGVELVEDDEAA